MSSPQPTPTLTPAIRRALAKELTRVAEADVHEVLQQIGDARPAAATRRVGFAGPPGAGKSTLVSNLAAHRLKKNDGTTLCVLAIDPSSPVSGGSILGDRIRMDAVAELPGLFIRSIPSRSGQSGLCENAIDLLCVTERYGFDEVFMETVGIGQSEVDIRQLVDTVVLLTTPDSGDSVQAMKAGILEIADIYVITKSENPAAKRMASEIETVVHASPGGHGGWAPLVIMTEADGTGVGALSAAIDAHRGFLLAQTTPQQIDAQRRRYHLKSIIDRAVDEALHTTGPLAERPLLDAYRALLSGLTQGAG